MNDLTHTLRVSEGGGLRITQHKPESSDLIQECKRIEKALAAFQGMIHAPDLDGPALPEIDTRPKPGLYRVRLGDDGNLEVGGRVTYEAPPRKWHVVEGAPQA